jgi:hypothetical protein
MNYHAAHNAKTETLRKCWRRMMKEDLTGKSEFQEQKWRKYVLHELDK